MIKFGETNILGTEVLQDGTKIGRVRKNTEGAQIVSSNNIGIGRTAARGWYAIPTGESSVWFSTRAKAVDFLARRAV